MSIVPEPIEKFPASQRRWRIRRILHNSSTVGTLSSNDAWNAMLNIHVLKVSRSLRQDALMNSDRTSGPLADKYNSWLLTAPNHEKSVVCSRSTASRLQASDCKRYLKSEPPSITHIMRSMDYSYNAQHCWYTSKGDVYRKLVMKIILSVPTPEQQSQRNRMRLQSSALDLLLWINYSPIHIFYASALIQFSPMGHLGYNRISSTWHIAI